PSDPSAEIGDGPTGRPKPTELCEVDAGSRLQTSICDGLTLEKGSLIDILKRVRKLKSLRRQNWRVSPDFIELRIDALVRHDPAVRTGKIGQNDVPDLILTAMFCVREVKSGALVTGDLVVASVDLRHEFAEVAVGQ